MVAVPAYPDSSIDCCQAFADSYELSSLPAMRRVEQAVLGCDFGGTSWTTSRQADRVAGSLALGPGRRLLEIGAGSGWPGLYFAASTGCHVTLLDLPENALAKATSRAEDEGIADRVVAVSASAAAMPFDEETFDVVSHSDVLCCLPEKAEVLAECRRVARAGATMHFSVIAVPIGLDPETRQEAIETGPPFVDSTAPYPEMIEKAGWQILAHENVTEEYRRSLGVLADAFDEDKDLAQSLGTEVVREASAHRRQQIAAIEAGWLIRETWLVMAD